MKDGDHRAIRCDDVLHIVIDCLAFLMTKGRAPTANRLIQFRVNVPPRVGTPVRLRGPSETCTGVALGGGTPSLQHLPPGAPREATVTAPVFSPRQVAFDPIA